VQLTDGTATRSHLVTNLMVTAIDKDNDTVSGTAEPGSLVEVLMCNEFGCATRNQMADDQGNWTAGFAQPGDEPFEQDTRDLVPGSNGWAQQTDEDGDRTHIWWNVPNPTFSVRLTEQQVHGYQWPLGNTVTLTIDDPANGPGVDYSATTTSEVDPWNPEQTWLGFDLNGAMVLQAGLLVTMSDGDTTKTHTVTNLVVTGVDVDTDIVFGTADPGSWLKVNACNNNGCGDRQVWPDAAGNWTANFAVPGAEDWEQTLVDIAEGSKGETWQGDEDWDDTQYGWWVPAPPFLCEAGNNISGVVYEADGQTPLAGAEVHFDGFDSGEPLYYTLTGPDGGYACGLPDGVYRVYAVGGGYARQHYPQTIHENAAPLSISSGTIYSDVDFSLDTASYVYDHFTFNLSDPVVGDLAVRQAIAYGTDRPAILAVTYPSSPLMDSYLPPSHWAYSGSGLPQYDYDPLLAADILTAAGWADTDGDGVRERNGLRLHIDYYTSAPNPMRAMIAQMFANDMAVIGVEVEVHAVPWSELTPVLENHTFGIAQFAWLFDPNEPTYEQWNVFTTSNPNNYGLYSNPTADQLAAAASAAPTRAEKRPYVVDHQILVMTDLATLPLFQRCDPPDGDCDGVTDTVDQCPAEYALGFDADHNGCQDTFTGLAELIQSLPAEAITPQLRALLLVEAKLARYTYLLGKDKLAIAQLVVFIIHVELQSGRKISPEAADLLVNYALNLITLIQRNQTPL
jgi:hypothetical protein